jgi:hypothetical protein
MEQEEKAHDVASTASVSNGESVEFRGGDKWGF